MRPIILIPARLASTRLPRKPLAPINGLAMIVHVLARAREAEIGPVAVAVSEQEVADVVKDAGGTVVMTDPDLASGSDRIHAALQELDPGGSHDVVINLQGVFAPWSRQTFCAKCCGHWVRPIMTSAPLPRSSSTRPNGPIPNVTKVVMADPAGEAIAKAFYFTRATCPAGEGPLYHHIGLYSYRRDALDRFVKLPPSSLERRERLEQLRALEAGMTIGVVLTDEIPLGVDTPADLEKVRRLMAEGHLSAKRWRQGVKGD